MKKQSWLLLLLFFYECLRLLFLVIFLLTPSFDFFAGGVYSVYMSSNALFPMMVLFMWLKQEEYRNYATLFMAGKFIAVIVFFVWEFFSFRGFSGMLNTAGNMILFFGTALLSLLDIFSVWGVWMVSRKWR